MHTLTVTLADLEGLPHGTVATRTSVEVTARYSREVILTDGTIIPPVIKSASIPGTGVASFEVYESDSAEVDPDYRDFAILVEATVADGPRHRGVTWRRTVKVLTSSPDPVALGTLPGTQGLPAKWTSINDLMDELATTVATELNDPNSAAYQAVAPAAVTAVEGELADPQSVIRQSINDAASTTAETVLTAELADETSSAYAAVVDAAATTTDPAIAANISDPGTDTRAALQSFTERVEVNVLDYGAVGDGVTDDTTAIRAALDVPASRKRVVLPGGRDYLVTGTLVPPAGTHVYGPGAIVTMSGAGRMWLVNADDVTLDGFTVDMDKASNVDGGSDFNQQGIYLNNPTAPFSRVNVRGVTVRNSHRYGIALAEGGSPLNAISDVVISGCTVTGCKRGISVVQNTGQRVTVTGNTIDAPTLQGIVVTAGTDARISDNTVTDPGDHGIVIGGLPSAIVDRATVTGNTITGAIKYGVAVSMSVEAWTVSGNTITDCNDGGVTVDVELAGELGVIKDGDGTVSGNAIARMGQTIGAGIGVLLRYAHGVVVNGNRISDALTAVGLHSSTAGTVTGNAFTRCAKGIDAQQSAGVTAGGHVVTSNTATDVATLWTGLAAQAVPSSISWGVTRLPKYSASARSSTTTLTPDEHLTMAVQAGRTYDVAGTLSYSGSPSGDIAVRFAAPATGSFTLTYLDPSATALGPMQSATYDLNAGATPTVVAGCVGTGTRTVIEVAGSITATSDGTLALEWAQGTSNATTTVLQSSSVLRVELI